MEFEIDLYANTNEEGGIAGSFANQLAAFGETQSVEMLNQKGPYRVDTSGGLFYFEVRRTYRIVL